MYLLRMTFHSCFESFDSAGFFVLFSSVVHTTASVFLYLGFRPSLSYDRFYISCLAMLVKQPTASASVLWVPRLSYLSCWVKSSQTQRLWSFNTRVVVFASFPLFSIIFF